MYSRWYSERTKKSVKSPQSSNRIGNTTHGAVQCIIYSRPKIRIEDREMGRRRIPDAGIMVLYGWVGQVRMRVIREILVRLQPPKTKLSQPQNRRMKQGLSILLFHWEFQIWDFSFTSISHLQSHSCSLFLLHNPVDADCGYYFELGRICEGTVGRDFSFHNTSISTKTGTTW
jgi:hypothetical protein